MTPTNNKSLLNFIFNQMDRLDKNEIDINQAKTQALLAKQANNALKYELDRANTQMKLAEHNRDSARIDLRNAEASNF